MQNEVVLAKMGRVTGHPEKRWCQSCFKMQDWFKGRYCESCKEHKFVKYTSKSYNPAKDSAFFRDKVVNHDELKRARQNNKHKNKIHDSEFGSKIRAELSRKGLSVQWLADEINSTYSALYNLLDNSSYFTKEKYERILYVVEAAKNQTNKIGEQGDD
jgi:ribosome-binding protein aMBF1 (putative translation factor)